LTCLLSGSGREAGLVLEGQARGANGSKHRMSWYRLRSYLAVALSGYGAPLVGEVTAMDGDRVSISLGSRQGVQVGDRFEVVHDLLLPDGTTMMEVRAVIEVLYVLGPDRAVCRIVESSFPIEVKDRVRPAP
jgi:hypothetical protein